MKIAIDARILPSSTGRYIERVLHHLQEVDREHEYFVLLDKKGFEIWHPTNPRFKKILADYSVYGADGQFKLARLLKQLRPDLVHFSFQQTALPYRGKKVITVHDLTQLRFRNEKGSSGLAYTAKQKVLNFGMRQSVRSSEKVLVPTEFVKGDLIAHFKTPASKIVVTYEAAENVNKKRTLKPLKNLQNQKFILYVGTAHAHKNLGRLIESLPLLQANYPSLQLVLAGKKTVFHDRLEQKARHEGISKVLFTDFVSDEQLDWLYQNCQAYVFPSLSEGFGLPGLEAMQQGAPVVSSQATCLPEVYGKAAHYFDPNDAGDIARAVREVLENSELRQQLITNGYKQVQKYSWRRTAQQTLEVYQSVLDQKD